MVTNEPWYSKLNSKYGPEFCVSAGYFPEDCEFRTPYSDAFDLVQNTTVIQFSGAFFPFHMGHLNNVHNAIDALNVDDGVVYIHVDHNSYRHSKGMYDETRGMSLNEILVEMFPYRGWTAIVLDENKIAENCSRNFTRLYSELIAAGNDTYFLCGGDRANYALTFMDEGKCIVAGRSGSDNYIRFKPFFENRERFKFIDRSDDYSSTNMRELQNNALNDST